ncbi:MAG TPA: aminoglycoside phosphotransferase family protein [Pseudonocardiaceae bacterium]|nr:aminoglycoside phosphotransferase family protein [Pseudonocardiaceae bacterium]
MSGPADDLRVGVREWVEQVIGSVQVMADRSWAHGESFVVQVRDGDGAEWFVKRHRNAEKHARELAAYQHWVPALGSRAPSLRAHDTELRTLLLSSVPGATGTADAMTPQVQYQAGELLRALHGAAPEQPWPDFVAGQLERFEKWATRAAGLVDARSLDFGRAQVRAMAGLPAQVRLPCHMDYGPRNWLVAAGRLHVIDFEFARPRCWLEDLGRLYYEPWRDHPDARTAFLAGYGRSLSDDDVGVLAALGASTAVSTIVWAREHDDPPFEETGRRRLADLMATADR